ncbi:hydroxyethylthiazole kinase [Tissierella sp. Yu-01]|uniref:hydroxyethylthiazole kinase n=1 Tax=Tissierella sp. Yu-01 TaxID=3035694 RepID=UPI00240DF06A|nr:hydroxyethylthiazole kinase [Tissierella sp. Yu-01]WFA08411.1 hydroxyethylthiazole kinase [Tissierella sp. Yu-01]
MFKKVLENVEQNPQLIHCITNYVTVNDVANAILASGNSPIMADDKNEVEDITSVCNALCINIGTLNERTIESMIIAGKKANLLGHPVILDPVGAGASKLRTDTTFKLLDNVRFSVIRGNISEIKTVYAGSGTTRGVDADISDAVTEANLDEAVKFAKDLSLKLGAVIAITGEIDIVVGTNKVYIIRNGHPLMSKITGTGCMLSGLISGYVSANMDNIVDGVAAAVSIMGLCGELGYQRIIQNNGGTSSLRTYIIDEISKMNWGTLERGMKVELR